MQTADRITVTANLIQALMAAVQAADAAGLTDEAIVKAIDAVRYAVTDEE